MTIRRELHDVHPANFRVVLFLDLGALHRGFWKVQVVRFLGRGESLEFRERAWDAFDHRDDILARRHLGVRIRIVALIGNTRALICRLDLVRRRRFALTLSSARTACVMNIGLCYGLAPSLCASFIPLPLETHE